MEDGYQITGDLLCYNLTLNKTGEIVSQYYANSTVQELMYQYFQDIGYTSANLFLNITQMNNTGAQRFEIIWANHFASYISDNYISEQSISSTFFIN